MLYPDFTSNLSFTLFPSYLAHSISSFQDFFNKIPCPLSKKSTFHHFLSPFFIFFITYHLGLFFIFACLIMYVLSLLLDYTTQEQEIYLVFTAMCPRFRLLPIIQQVLNKHMLIINESIDIPITLLSKHFTTRIVREEGGKEEIINTTKSQLR